MKKSLCLLLLCALPFASQAAPKKTHTQAVSTTLTVSTTEGLNPPASTLPPDIRVLDASIPAAAQGQSPAVSMMLVNATSSTIVIRGASSPVAQMVRLQHITTTPEGLRQMDVLPRLIIPAGTNGVLAPAATELRLLNLSSALEEGYETPLTLIFLDGTSKTVRLHIKADH